MKDTIPLYYSIQRLIFVTFLNNFEFVRENHQGNDLSILSIEFCIKSTRVNREIFLPSDL